MGRSANWLAVTASATALLALSGAARASAEAATGAANGSTASDGSVDQPPKPAASDQNASSVTEVVVTANRRSEFAQKVPATLSVISGASIEERGIKDFSGYLSSIPSVGVTDLGAGQLNIGIRGVSNTVASQYGVTDSVQAVGLYLNDIPISGAASLPDLDIYDLERIEVLKGPQGALYGEGAMGGTIRMLVHQPDLTSYSAKLESTVGGTEHGGTDYDFRGLINIPIVTDKLGVRGSFTDSHNDGWIDDTALHQNGINSSNHYSGRLLATYVPNDWLTINGLYVIDREKADRYNEVNPALGDLKTDQIAQPSSTSKNQIFGLTAIATSQFATLTSNTSYVTYDRDFTPQLTVAGIAPEQFYTASNQKTFTQEVRAVSADEGLVRWIAGGFYRHRTDDVCGNLYAPNVIAAYGAYAGGFTTAAACSFAPATGQSVTVVDRYAAESFDQAAAYGEVSLNFKSGLRIFVGFRYYDENAGLKQQLLASGVFAAASTPLTTVKTSDTGVVGRAGASYQVDQNILIYALWSQGYRSGGPNLNYAYAPALVPPAYSPDGLNNYEIGVKSAWFQNRLIANVTASYIDWTKMQAAQEVVAPTLGPQGYFGNAGDSSIKGVEFDLVGRPARTTQVGITGAYQDSRFDKNQPGALVVAQVGAELPNAPKWTLSAFAEQTFPLSDGNALFARVDAQYVDSQYNYLITTLQPASTSFLPQYTIANFHFGWRVGRYEIVGFANNAFDKRYYIGHDIQGGGYLVVGRPADYGVTVRANF